MITLYSLIFVGSCSHEIELNVLSQDQGFILATSEFKKYKVSAQLSSGLYVGFVIKFSLVPKIEKISI